MDSRVSARARALIDAAIERRRGSGLLGDDEDLLPGAVTAKQAVDLMRAPSATAATIAPFDYAGTRLGALGERLGLDARQLDLLAVLFACETDPVAARLVTFLGGNQTQFALTFDLVLEVVYAGAADEPWLRAALLHQDLLPEHALRRLKLVLVDGDPKASLSRTLRLHARLGGWLFGVGGGDAEVAAVAEVYPPAPPPAAPADELVAVALQALLRPGRLLLVEGPAGSGRRLLLRAAAHRLGRPLLVARTRALTAERLTALFREALLEQAVLAFAVDEALPAELEQRLVECLAASDDTIALLAGAGQRLAVLGLRPVVPLQLAVPPHQERRALWQAHLGAGAQLDDDQWSEVAGLYNLGLGGIVRAGELARDLAEAYARPLGRADVAAAVRQLFDVDLGAVGRRVEVTQDWNDIVLTDEVGAGLADMVDRILYRSDVFGDWGFAGKLGKGLGLTLLFSGEPGTGKSMAAGLLARTLGLDLYAIDLSRIASKWLGETEKNLGLAFDAAEAGHVVLLFDEADTVLAKRTSELRSANDRYANQETNYILGRLEQFHGIAIFTTNMASGIDAAVLRRMSAHIRFPFPDEVARAELWRRMIPSATPVAGDIDFDALGRKFEISGGFIRNIVLRAAFRARRQGSPLTMRLLEQAARAEYLERGKLTVGGRLE